MGISFTGLGVSLALLFVLGALIYYFWCRKKKAANPGASESTVQGNFTSSGPGYPPSTQLSTVPVGWNVDPNASAPKTAPYPTGGVSDSASYPTGGGVPGAAPYPTAGDPRSAWGETANPSAPPPYPSSPPPYPS